MPPTRQGLRAIQILATPQPTETSRQRAHWVAMAPSPPFPSSRPRQDHGHRQSFTIPPSSPSRSPSPPTSPHACHALRFRVYFPPASNNVSASSNPSTARFGDTQTLNIAFNDDFVPTPDVDLSLHVRRYGPVRSLYGPVEDHALISSYSLCNVDEAVHIDPGTRPIPKAPGRGEAESRVATEVRPQPLGNTSFRR